MNIQSACALNTQYIKWLENEHGFPTESNSDKLSVVALSQFLNSKLNTELNYTICAGNGRNETYAMSANFVSRRYLSELLHYKHVQLK
jgi:hypothetical protein